MRYGGEAACATVHTARTSLWFVIAGSIKAAADITFCRTRKLRILHNPLRKTKGSANKFSYFILYHKLRICQSVFKQSAQLCKNVSKKFFIFVQTVHRLFRRTSTLLADIGGGKYILQYKALQNSR